MPNLREFRQLKLKLNKKELAEQLEVEEKEIELLDRQEIRDIPYKYIERLARIAGITVGAVYDYEPFEVINIKDNWSKNVKFKEGLIKLIEDEKRIILEKYASLDEVKYIDQIKKTLLCSIRKPRVALMGMSDAGKSSFINSIIGLEKMPVSWTPTTSIAVYIKHINDRPSFIHDETWIFKFKDDENNEWDINNIDNEEYCNRFKLSSGSVDILQDYGIRQGSKYSIEDAGSAVVYVDSDILKVCDIIDLPGFCTGDRENDDILSEKAKKQADIVVYMSQATGFLKGVDIEFLKGAIKAIPVLENKNNKIEPLENLFIIASQAHNVGNEDKIKDILNCGCDRLYNNIPVEVWHEKEEISGFSYNKEILKKRFYSYTIDRRDLRANFEQQFTILLEKLPSIILEQTILNLKSICVDNKVLMGKQIKQLELILKEKEKSKKMLENLKEKEEKIKIENNEYRNTLINTIEDYKRLSKLSFDDMYDNFISISNIENIIDRKGYRKKKEDIDLLIGYINSSLESKLENILKESSKKLSIDIEKYIGIFDKIIGDITEGTNINLSFDVKRLFASGLASAATLGGLSVWASTLGNLGGYILVTKGVSILSAMGISIAGGTAAAVSTVSAIGGPVVLGIGLAILAGLSVFSLLKGGWKRNVAKKIVKEYEKQNTKVKIHKILDDFWDSTIEAFNIGADNLEKEYSYQINNLYIASNSSSDEDIQRNIEKYKELIEIFDKFTSRL